ncbi:MAG: hypothetical protein IJI92_09320 [Erysipelotrichaceae bacterium]|nr:hypothetical protein [Erysipelotrichaceae bacterium]
MKPGFAICKDITKGYSGGFEQLLRQEKTIYTVVNERSELPVTCFENHFPEWAYSYVEDGGIAIVSGAAKHTFSFDAGFKAKAGIEMIDLSEFDQGKARIVSTVNVFSGEGKGELTLHENRTIKQGLRPGFYPVFLYHELGKGTIIYTGVPMAEILTYEGSDLRTTTNMPDFDERISSVDKQKVAAALRAILKEAMHMAGYPYVSLWYFPDGARNIFAYSIDADGLLTEGVNNLLKAAEQTGTKLTFYINRQLCEDDPQLYEKLSAIAEHNILASHGSIHNGKDSYEDNINDLKDLEDWMSSLGFTVEKSYASPRGMYCHELGKALKETGYRHSRDFGFAIDDYPFFPLNEGDDDSVLQIPCDGFNVCRLMGRNKELDLPEPTAEEIIGIYMRLIDYKMERDLPLLFFCHPQYFGLYAKEVYPEIVSYAAGKGALLTDYVSYGDFWIARDQCEYSADYDGKKLNIRFIAKDPRVRICVDGKIFEE